MNTTKYRMKAENVAILQMAVVENTCSLVVSVLNLNLAFENFEASHQPSL